MKRLTLTALLLLLTVAGTGCTIGPHASRSNVAAAIAQSDPSMTPEARQSIASTPSISEGFTLVCQGR